jgi:hypothetical protein
VGVDNCTVVRDWMHFLILFLTPTFISISSSAHLLIIILDRWARPLLVWYSDVESVLAAQSSALAAACSWVLGGGLTPGQSTVSGPVLARMGHARSWFSGSCWAKRENKGTSTVHTWCGFPKTSSGIVWLVRITHHHPIACHSSVTHPVTHLGKKKRRASRKAERSLKKNEERAFCTQANQVRKTSQSTLGVLPSHMRA